MTAPEGTVPMSRQDDTFNGNADRLSALLDLEAHARTAYTPHDLAAILHHQLDTPLAVDLAAGPGVAPTETFGQLLLGPAPSLDALARVKDFAKAARGDPNGPLPPEIATVLYYASIAAARLRHGRRITALDDATLRRGLAWMAAERWCAAPLGPLLAEAISALAHQ